MDLLTLDRLILHTPQGRRLNKPASVTLRSGECLVVRGPNGTGKSTLLRAVLGLHRHYFGKATTSIARSDIAYLPQLQNQAVHFPLTLADLVGFSDHKAATTDIEQLGLLHTAQLGLRWNGASGGERVRALLTLLLLERPKLLILDEPFNHLDTASIGICTDLIRNFLSGGEGRAALLVTHSEPETVSWKELKKKELVLEHLGD